MSWLPRGVCVNAITPGLFPTELNRHLIEGTERGRELLLRTPMKRFGKVEELAGAAVFLASDAASFVNGEITGEDTASWDGYLRALWIRRRYFAERGGSEWESRVLGLRQQPPSAHAHLH